MLKADSNNYRNNKKNRKWFARPLIWSLVVVFILLVFSIHRTYQIYMYELPSIEEVYNIEPPLKTKIYAGDGTLLKEYYNQNRILVPYAKIPPHMIQMLLAVEDKDFFDHWGIHPRRILFVAIKNILSMRIEAGASTVTQQVSRMLFLTREQTLERKFKEALTSIKLERTYSKTEIIEMYLNLYYFHRAYGVGAAARATFSKDISDLDISECSILLGMLKGPVINSPFMNPDKALKARNRVLYAFYKNGGISEELYDSLRTEPLVINPPEEDLGQAPYFTEYIRKYIEDTYGVDMLYNGGLKIQTALNLDLQQAAEEAIASHLDSLQARIEAAHRLTDAKYTRVLPDTVDENGDSIRVYKQIQGASVVINNKTGDVLAMVGGRDFEKTKYNRAVQAPRQPGSSFKPFVYTAAIDNGWTPDSILYDNSIVLDIPGSDDWRPHNWDYQYLGKMSIRTGLKKSRNMVAIKLILKIRPELAVFYAQQMGIKSPLRPVPSLAIGTSEVFVEELVAAFMVFPNGGIKINPRHIITIEDRYGNVLEDNRAIHKEEILAEETAYIMVNMLQSVMEPGGTGYAARWRGFTRPAGGKTGTTDDFRDNWFIGFTPQITAGVWVGFDDNTSIGHNMTGSANGLPIWTRIMLAAHQNLPVEDFTIPPGIVFADICSESHKLATSHCPEVVKETFTGQTLPTGTCDMHNRGTYHTGDDNPADTSQTIRF